MTDHATRIEAAAQELTEAVQAAGFEAAREYLTYWRDEGDADQPEWHDPFADALHHAVSVAQHADRCDSGGEYPKFLSVTGASGECITWEWQRADRDFAGMVLRSVVAALGYSEMTPRSTEALLAVVPVLRRWVHDYLRGVAVRKDLSSIHAADWEGASDEIRALRQAQACIGPPVDDLPGVDTAWLDAALVASPTYIPDEMAQEIRDREE